MISVHLSGLWLSALDFSLGQDVEQVRYFKKYKKLFCNIIVVFFIKYRLCLIAENF
jgi:hypothetical protein